jgi:hypothetical protein
VKLRFFAKWVSLIIGAGIAAGILTTRSLDHAPPTVEREATRSPRRIVEMIGVLDSSVTPKEFERALRASDDLLADGPVDVEVLLASVEVSEADVRAAYLDHRHVFGNRSFEAGREAATHLARIRKAREILEQRDSP